MAVREVEIGPSLCLYVADTVGEIPAYADCEPGELAFVKADQSWRLCCEDGWVTCPAIDEPAVFGATLHGHSTPKIIAGVVAALSLVEGGAAAWGDITGTLSAQSDLQTALNGKSDTSHHHDSTYEAKNANIQAHIASAHAPSNAQKNSDITKAEIEAKLTGEITSHSHAGGGADPWIYVQVNGGADFTTSANTAQNVTGLAFTPQANTTYEFEALLMIRTATATVNPRVGLAWPTGGADGVAIIEQAGATATAAHAVAAGNINAALLIAVGGLLNATQSWPVKVHGLFRSGASPSGEVRIQLASETAGTVVRIVARSFVKYRTLAF